MHQMKHQWNRYALTTLAIALAAGSTAATCLATDFTAKVAVTDLESPTAIAYTGRGSWVAISEIPTPGVFGDDGGMNRVSLLDVATGDMKELSFGEPLPLNIALDRQRENLYWTCNTAGVIFRRDNMGNKELYLEGLNHPSGITTAGPYIIFTEIGDPGTPSKMNTVMAYDGDTLMELTNGEPAPTDIVYADDGSLYWTCKTAGVILRMAPDGTKTHLLDGLNAPVGLAIDKVGHLYFTEVPTPGVSGKDGGKNKVWRYDLNDQSLDLVNDGDPEPTDIAVTPSGSHIFWTCTSAGVVVVAQED